MSTDVLQIKVVSTGITQSTNDLNKLGTAAENTEKKVIKLVETVNNMAKQFAAGASGTKAMTEALAASQRTTAASDAAMKSLANSISESNKVTKGLGEAFAILSKEVGVLNGRLQQTGTAVNNSTKHIVHHTAAMSEAHSAARGLTGALGALWLTYGNIAPLAAGAAIGASLKAIVTIGVDVENTLEAIRLKTGATSEEMVVLGKTISDLGRGIYGPQEVTKALETLSLAGLNATQAATAVGAALNLATSGGTSIEKSAEALVTIGTAVRATASEYDYLGDAIQKTANISLASVDSIAETVKRASVVNQLYGASFEDILTQAAALAQLGIKNSAAGTAITNFYANARAETDKAKKALDALGFSFQDASGKVKPLVQAFTEYNAALSKFDLNSQKDLITAQFGERALRDVQAVLSLLNQAAESTERLADGTLKYKNRLEEIQEEVKNSAGTAALVAAEQALTTENRFKAVGNTLKSTFLEAFESIGPAANNVAKILKDLFASEEFKTGLNNIVSGFGRLAEFLAKNIPLITAIAEGFIAVGIASAGGALFTRMIPAVQGLAVAFGAVTVAANGAAVATGLFGTAIKALPGIGLALGLASAAYALYSLHADKATKSTKELAEEKRKLADEYSGDFLGNLDKEIARLTEVNKQLEKGVDLTKAQSNATAEMALQKLRATNQEAIDAAQKDVDIAKKNPKLFSYIGQLEALKKLKTAQETLNNIKNKAAKDEEAALSRARKIVELTQAQSDMLKKREQAADAAAKAAAGTKTFAEKDNGVEKQLSFLDQENLALRRATLGYEVRTKAVIESYTSGQKAIVGSHQATVEANKLEGKYANDRIYREQLAKALAADTAKLELDRQQIYGEVSQKINDIIKAEEKRQEMANSGQVFKGLRKELEAAAAYTQISEKQLEIDRKRADEAERIRIAADNMKKLEAATGSTKQRAEGLIEEADAMAYYGQRTKLAAMAAAELLIEKLKLNTLADESAKNSLREAAALEQVGRAYNSLQKTSVSLNDELEKAQADGVLLFADNEEKKITIWANSLKKRAKMEMDAADAAADANPFNPEIQARAISAYSAYRDTVEKIDEVSREKINNAHLYDWKKTVDSIVDTTLDNFDNMFDAIKNMFKKIVIDYIKKEFAKPFVLNMVANISGSLGLTGISNTAAAMGGANKDGSPLGVVQAAKNIFDSISGGFDKIGSFVSQAASKLGFSSSTSGTIGGAASGLTGVSAGIGLGRGISGNFGSNSAINIGTAVGTFFGPIGSAIGGAIGGLINRAFGRGPKELQSSGIRGTIGTMGTTGESFQNYLQKGGWFRSDKRTTEKQGLSSDITNTLTSGFTELKSVTESFAKTVGISSGNLDGFTKNFDIAFGADAQKNQEAVTKFFTDLGDEFATKLIPNIVDFSRQGETASQTLERLSNVFDATNKVAAILGKNVEDVFGSLGLSSDKARERLVDFAGGLENLVSKTAEYANTFLTDAEKLTPVQKAVEAAMKSLGLESVKTKDQFKAIVNGLDLTTEAGAKLFNNLLDLAPAFAQVADAAEAARQAAEDAAKAAAEAAAKAAKEAYEAAVKAAMDNVDAAFNSLRKSVDVQKKLAKDNYDWQVSYIKAVGEARRKAAQEELNAAKENLSAITGIYDMLSGAMNSTKVESVEINRIRRQASIDYLNSIRGSDLTESKAGISGAINSLGNPSEQFFSTFEEYARDQAAASNALEGLKNQAGVEKTFAELTVERLDDTISAIQAQTESQLEQAQSAYESQIDYFDSILENAQKQIDALNGIDTSIKSLEAALRSFSSAINSANAVKSSGSSSSNTGTFVPGSTWPGGVPATSNIMTSWWEGTALDFQRMKDPNFVPRPLSFDVGTNYIPDDMMAMVHEGERIIPKADNAELMRRLDQDTQSVNYNAMCQELSEIKQAIISGDVANVQQTRELVRISKRWDQDGLPPERTV